MSRGGDDLTGTTAELESYEEARSFLENKHTTGELPIVVEYPWWVTLRVPLTIMAIGFLALGAALFMLSVLQMRDRNSTDETDDARACRDQYGAVIAERAAGSRAAIGSAQSAFNEGLITLIRGGRAESIDVDAIEEANARIPPAVLAELDAIAALNAWDEAGNPMPCPISAR